MEEEKQGVHDTYHGDQKELLIQILLLFFNHILKLRAFDNPYRFSL